MDDVRDIHIQQKRHHQALFRQLREILLEEDPLHIYNKVNPDEYDPEIVRILPKLETCKSTDDVRRVVYDVFASQFGAKTAGTEERYQRVAERIWPLLSGSL